MSILRRLACVALLSAMSVCAAAQELPMRMFPPAVKYATLRVASNYEATLNKDSVRLSPGFRLYTPQNIIILYNVVVNQPVKVAYTLDVQGLIQQAWILTDNEVSKIQPAERGFFYFSSGPFQ